LEQIVDSTNHFTFAQANEVATRKPLSFAKPFVRKALDALVTGGYVDVDESHPKGHFILNINMIQDERHYLDCWLRFKTGLPAES
jgi:hypothetical protein